MSSTSHDASPAGKTSRSHLADTFPAASQQHLAAPSAPTFQPLPRGRRRPRRRGRIRPLFALIVTALCGLTVWNLTRSDALEHARSAYTRGSLVLAIQHSLQHLGRQPWSREAALVAARALSRLDFPDEAELYYRRAGQLSLNDLHTRAYGFVRSNQRQRAIQAYEEILARQPDNTLALRRLAGIQMTQGNAPEIRKLADRLIQVPGSEVFGYTLRGVIQHDTQERKEAIAAFERVLELDPELHVMPLPHRLFWMDFALDLINQSRLDDVCRYIPPFLEKEPDGPLMALLGRAYYLKGEHDRAEQCFRQAIEWGPNDYSPLLQLGRLELHQHRFDDAQKHLERAVSLAPRNVDALYTLALVYRQSGKKVDADQIQSRIDQLRSAHATTTAPVAKAPPPRYAL